MKTVSAVLLLTVFSVCASTARETSFSRDSAFAVLTTLAARIGPRPMGSPAEHRALAFAVSRFKEYGCQESYLMPFTEARGVNTSSGVAVGVLRGKTGRIILIGGHMDSAGPDIPGANDDASGAAVVIEAARVLAKERHESTIVFCCWGGEEEGLCGSEYFVKTFPQIDSVVMMLQVDMADGRSYLGLDPDGAYQVSAPRWLVDAAYDVYYGELDESGLEYPTHSRTLNSSFKGMTGSDHMPFLQHGIPALDFTSDVDYPIHTPLDDLAHFTPSGLQRAGDLVLGLVSRFDGGVPSRRTERYWLLQFGTVPVYVSHVILWIFVVVSVALGIAALAAVRKRRTLDERAPRIRWSGMKLLLFTFMIQVFIWTSPNLVGLIRGVRFPWVNNIAGFYLLGVLAGALGVWCAVRLAARMRLAMDPFAYQLRASILLLLFTGLCALSNAELAVYPASALLFFALAMFARRPWVKVVLLALAPYLMFRLVFNEEAGLFQRLMTQAVLDTFLKTQIYHGLFVVFFTAISLPFVYAFAAVYRDAGTDILWLKKFARPMGLRVTGALAAVTVIVLLTRPVYDRYWQPIVRVNEKIAVGTESLRLALSSAEYMDGVRVIAGGIDTTLHGRVEVDTLALPFAPQASLCTIVTRTEMIDTTGLADSVRAAKRVLEIRSKARPLRVNVQYRSPDTISCSSEWTMRSGGRLDRPSPNIRSLSWYAFPDSVLVIPVTFLLRGSQRIAESVEVTFDTLAVPVTVSRDLTCFSRRTIVTREDTFGAPREGDRFAARSMARPDDGGNRSVGSDE